MASTPPAFSRRKPDVMTEELVSILSGKAAFEFKALFDLLYANLQARRAVSGGEEMLRLRAYEKLQGLVYGGSVKKEAKKYRGVAAGLALVSLQLESYRTAAAARLVAVPGTVAAA